MSKICKDCKLELSEISFISKRDKICKSCKRVRRIQEAANKDRRKLNRLKKKKEKTKTVIKISDLKKKVQRKVNRYIRKRDKDKPCISCGKYMDKKEAGHYIAQGSSGFLRYDLDNIHGQCAACNRWKHGNLVEYRIGLVKKIGEYRVVQLEKKRSLIKKWKREELEELLEELK